MSYFLKIAYFHTTFPAQPKEQITPTTKSAGGNTKSVHINPGQRAGPGRRNKSAGAPGTEGGPRKPRQVRRSRTAQRVNLGGRGKPTQVTPMQRNPHKRPPSKFRTAAQGRTEEERRERWFQGQVEAGGTADMLRGPFWSDCGNRRS